VIEQIMKQLNKLIDVIKVKDLSEIDHVEREMMLIKVLAENMDACGSVKRIVDTFCARTVDVKSKTFTVEVTGNSEKINAFIEAVDEHTILELVRSGSIGISRGKKTLHI
jgi:acetolactate synthase-1/3 small subunit